jgi:hypothetical protein
MSDSDSTDIDKNDQSLEAAQSPASPIAPEVLQKLPAELQRLVVSLQSVTAPVFNPVLQKINEEHITKVLDQAESDSERDFSDRRSARRYGLLYALLAAILFVFVTIYLAGQDKELYRDLLTKIIIFFGGGGLGYGIKAFRDRDD